MFEKKTSKEVNHEFATTTSMHGVYFLHTSQSKIIKAFWCILIFGMVCALVSQVAIRIYEYFQYETSTDITENFVSYLNFPAVTICSFNRYFLTQTDARTLDGIHTLNRMTSPSYIAYSTHMKIKPNISKIEPLGTDAINITKMADRLGFSITKNNMPKCRFKTTDCEPEEFSTIFTSLGKCYTFNEDNKTRTQNIPGAGHGLAVTLDIKQDQYTEEPFLGNTEAGLKIQIHPPYEAPDVETFGLSIPVGMKANIEVSRRDYDMMYEPWGRCIPNKESLKYFSTYTLKNCVQECYTNAVINHCGCRLFTQYWASDYARQCSVEEMQDCASEYLITLQENYSATDCGCTIACKSTDYDLTVSYATYPNLPNIRALEKRFKVGEEYVKGNSIEFEVYYKSMSYSTFSQSKKVDESGLLSDIGGQLGLWLGMSVITAVEIMGFFFKAARLAGSSKKNAKVHDENPKT